MANRLISKSGIHHLEELLAREVISAHEFEVCIRANEADDPNIFLGYWTLRGGEDQQYCRICQCGSGTCRYPKKHSGGYWIRRGLQLFPWQVNVIMGNMEDMYGNPAHTITILGGPGCGKSLLLATANMMWGALNPGFIGLCPAPTSEQNSAVLREAVKHFHGTRFSQVFLETDISAKTANKPLVIKFKNGSSTQLFTTSAFAGGARAGTKNLGKEGDAGAYDEAGIDERFPVNFQVLGTRMRGTRSDGTPRGITYPNGERITMMLLISNPNPNNIAWDEFVNYTATAPGFKVMEVSTDSNKAITQTQGAIVRDRVIAAVVAQHGDIEDAEAILSGSQDSIGGGEVFSKATIERTVDSGYDITEYVVRSLYGSQGSGNFEFFIPPMSGHRYTISVDPGVSFAPRRNAPTIGVWDVTDLNSTYLVGLYWGAIIEGDPTHYLYKIREWIDLYACTASIDTTGPQYLILGRTELADVSTRLLGCAYPANIKRSIQVMLREDATSGLIRVPNYSYFRRQMRSYTWSDSNKSLPQDLISMMMVFADWRRAATSSDSLRAFAKQQVEDAVQQYILTQRHGSHDATRTRGHER